MIELMVAVTIGLFISLGVTTLFIQNKNSFNQNDQITSLQDNGRFALNMLLDDLSAVGYYGGMTDPENINTSDANLAFSSGAECGSAVNWTYSTTYSVTYLSSTTTAAAQAKYPCLSTVQSGTDVMLIKRVRGTSTTAASSLTSGKVYLRSNRTTGAFFKKVASTADPSSGQSDWEYYTRLYYIESNQLKRKSISPSASNLSMQEEVIAAGIERFHIEFGIDANSDNVADYFTSSPTDANLQNAVAARVYVLARGENTVAGYSNTKTYNLGDTSVGPFNDAYYRRVYSASTPLRNIISTRQFSNT